MIENANSHEGIKERLITANRFYFGFGLSILFNSKLILRRSKIKLYKVLIRSTVPILYAGET